MLTHTQYVNNIYQVYQQTFQSERERSKDWYVVAHNHAKRISDETSIPLTHVIGVMSALSPRCRWEKNLEDTEIACKFGTQKLTATLTASKDKAERILQGEHPETVLGGPKTKAFYQNILSKGTDSQVTVDSHAIRAAYYNRKHSGNLTAKEYARVEAAYQEVANLVGITPPQLQAIVWDSWRNQGQAYLPL